MADIEDPRGKHLLGEAVRLLVQSGVTGAAITDFIQAYSTVVHATLAAPPAAPNDMKAQLKEALKEALQEIAPTGKQSSSALRKQVGVLVNGARTTLSLDRNLVERAVIVAGGKKQAQQLVEELANTKPESEPVRSTWVETQLQQRLLLLKAESTLSKSATH
jgi:hypothetical protein